MKNVSINLRDIVFYVMCNVLIRINLSFECKCICTFYLPYCTIELLIYSYTFKFQVTATLYQLHTFHLYEGYNL